MHGDIATADLIADFSGFGGERITRTDGKMDVDPSFFGGLAGTYRLNQHVTFAGTWLHSRGRLRVTFPALSRDPGDFDLEGFILAASDQTQQFLGGSRATSAMADAISDFYLLSGTYELSPISKRFIPYATLGGGILREVSDGPVFKLDYEGALPPLAETMQIAGQSWEENIFGLPMISLDETNPVVTIGGGVRVTLGSKWNAGFEIEDLIRINPDFQSLSGSVPPPNPGGEGGDLRPFGVTVEPSDAMIVHNLGFRFSLGYALWPFGAPR
ncbi:MAG TPA: hypothetical protein VFR10_13865 [bacterium]|nr:hypothetical protein [bacterium]